MTSPVIVTLIASTVLAASPVEPGAPRLDPSAIADEEQPPRAPIVPQAVTPISPPKLHLERSWYGWQTLLASTGSLAMMVGGALSSNKTVGDIGLVAYAIGPGIVHAAHGNFGKAAGSVAIQVGTPFTLGFTGLVIGSVVQTQAKCDNLGCIVGPLEGFIIGFLVGLVAAPIMDAALLSWQDDQVADSPEPVAATSVRIIPTISLRPERTTFGLAAAF